MSLKKDFVNGVFWIALAKYSGILISLVVSAVLARMISPTAFGTIAIAMVVLHFLNILADIGIGPAIVQYKELSTNKLNDIFTLTILIGFFLSLLLFFFAHVIASFYADEILINVCRWMCVVLFFNSINVVPNGIMRREKRFKTIAYRTLFFQLISGGLAILAALSGWGVYALLVAPIITAIGVFCVNFYNYPQRISLRIHRNSISAIYSFSIYQFLFTFFNYFSRNLDKLIIGRSFSLTQLGYYDKSYHLMMLPVQNLSSVIDPVLHPILVSLKDYKDELKKKNILLARTLANISFPIGLIFYFCGNEIVKIVYGNRWDDAIPIFQILSLSLPLQIIFSTIAPIYQAADKTRVMFYGGMLNTLITVTGFFIAAFGVKTIESVAWSWDVTLLINFFNSYYILHHYALKQSPKDFFYSLRPQLLNSAIVFAGAIVLFPLFPLSLNIILSFVLKVILIVSSTILLASLFNQYRFDKVIFSIISKQRTSL